MPIKRSLARRFADRCYSTMSILLLPPIALLPLFLRERLMHTYAGFFWPLVRSMLVPAAQRDPHSARPLALPGLDPKSTHATILFGGNDCLRNEVAPLVEGISFHDGSTFHTQQRPLLLMPLLEAPTEKEYMNRAFSEVMKFLENFKRLERVYVIGHSLGAAITIQLVSKMRRKGPQDLKWFMALDRSFSSLSEVAIYLYPLSGWVMSRTLGLIWSFSSAETLRDLSDDPYVFCRLYQVTPDHVIGCAELLPKLRSFYKAQSWPERWSYHTLSWPDNNTAHILPFEEAFSLQESRKAAAQSCPYKQNPATASISREQRLP